jgi:hypothetical protein
VNSASRVEAAVAIDRPPCHIRDMAEKRIKRPRDPLQLAKLIGDIATGQVEDRVEDGKDPAAVEFARRGGQKGGAARAAKLTPEKRREIAAKAAASRWKK